MAGIDKTYTDSYEEYIKFKSWASEQVVVFFDGFKKCIGDYVFDWWGEEDFTQERPIMNTPNWVDIYLIQNCPFEFVQKRMKDVYSQKTYNEFKNKEFPVKLPEDYRQNRKIIIRKIPKITEFPLHNKPYSPFKEWWLSPESYDWEYNKKTRRWVHTSMYYPTHTNVSHPRTIKAMIRQLRKQYLPSEVKFRLSGGYIGEDYRVIVK
jgi:hypothetical protein